LNLKVLTTQFPLCVAGRPRRFSSCPERLRLGANQGVPGRNEKPVGRETDTTSRGCVPYLWPGADINLQVDRDHSQVYVEPQCRMAAFCRADARRSPRHGTREFLSSCGPVFGIRGLHFRRHGLPAAFRAGRLINASRAPGEFRSLPWLAAVGGESAFR
jgi:hypothetical protein